MRRIVLVACLLCVACGGASGSGAKAEPSGSPAAECLKLANTPRPAPDRAPEKLSLSQIVVRHNELPPSEATERTREQACLIAQEAREALLAGGEWSEVVAKYSDGAQATQGSLGTVSYDELEKKFANTAFGLQDGEVSHVLETKRGFHVIVRMPAP